MIALSMAALKRQLTALADEYSGLSPQVAARIAKDALEAIEKVEADTRNYCAQIARDRAKAWNAMSESDSAPNVTEKFWGMSRGADKVALAISDGVQS